jgi:hypothetical protein
MDGPYAGLVFGNNLTLFCSRCYETACELHRGSEEGCEDCYVEYCHVRVMRKGYLTCSSAAM